MGFINWNSDRKTEKVVQKKPTPSLIIEELKTELLSRKSPWVLDLGRACDANVQFYSSLSAKIQYEDLVSPVTERATTIIENQNIFENLTNTFIGNSYDLIVVWDLFLYLTRSEIKELGELLSRCIHPGTRLFSLTSNRSEISETPIQFKIDDRCILTQHSTSKASVQATSCSSKELELLLPNFVRHRSVLLRNGMEEQVFHVKLPR